MTVVDGMVKAVDATVATDVFIGQQPSYTMEPLWHMPRRTDTHNAVISGARFTNDKYSYLDCVRFNNLVIGNTMTTKLEKLKAEYAAKLSAIDEVIKTEKQLLADAREAKDPADEIAV
jgi:hypothetical protein